MCAPRRASVIAKRSLTLQYHLHTRAGGKNADFMKKSCPESCKEKGYDPPATPTPPKEKKRKKKGKRRAKQGVLEPAGLGDKDEV